MADLQKHTAADPTHMSVGIGSILRRLETFKHADNGDAALPAFVDECDAMRLREGSYWRLDGDAERRARRLHHDDVVLTRSDVAQHALLHGRAAEVLIHRVVEPFVRGDVVAPSAQRGREVLRPLRSREEDEDA